MNKLELFLLVATFLAVLVSICVILWNRRITKRTLTTINHMLDAAIQGTFSEEVFDESLQSSAETKLSHYLSASKVSAKNLAEEKNRIKELISDISHQTKTPLSNILLYSELLGEQALPEESKPCVVALHAQAEKLSFLIDFLVKTSRLETGILALHPAQNELQPMIDDITAQIAPKVGAKEIGITVIPTIETAYFDPKWTSEALYNILDNAVKYTPEGGCIRFSVTPYELFCRIDITDSGIGIAEEEQTKIFQRFYRSPSAFSSEGVGIGLYLAREIIQSEGGYVKVSSTLGTGTTFSVFLLRES
ncbi:MAG: ATP-binding region ATPase domain protein [Evtepia sp.]|jgi:signal transduction histidine kinase|nr:ATP-binding region ATPase domain protein [Evtepia sp.]